MTVGIRIRGAAGQVQIDDQTPVFVVSERGTIGSGNLVADVPDVFFLGSRHHVVFAKPYTTQGPPLVFLRFLDSEAIMTTFTMRGGPGNWTGFNIAVGTGMVRMVARNLKYFVATPTPPAPSGARVGIRIRNKTTGQLTFDSGWPLVKFIQQTANFQADGRYSHGVLIYSIGQPAGAEVYFMANGFSGVINAFPGDSVQFMHVGVGSTFPGKLLLYTRASSGDNDIAYQAYQWSALFASPGA